MKHLGLEIGVLQQWRGIIATWIGNYSTIMKYITFDQAIKKRNNIAIADKNAFAFKPSD